ncbi:SIS domain-containing protein [uncultured Fusobacterium sp.]|jgi:tagatose-6-phosphate ketose/aldose isomerase|uniref:SIS domain-containing protein n=1 Tax=Fusobacterium sp. TaxID=68766 RepID=UPI0025EB65CE|nr:SIS domain-containing protein [uncultured Fusobacterium sp.]
MNFKDCVTWKEIAQQPGIWKEEVSIVKENIEALGKFIEGVKGNKVKVIFTGAGSSEFVGNTICSYINSRIDIEVLSVPTTDIVSMPEQYLDADADIILVSCARSGNSPESVAAVELADKLVKNIHHIFITCNKDGKLAKISETGENKYLLLMPERTNDKGFAMTGSFSSMVVAGVLVLLRKDLDVLGEKVEYVASLVERNLDKIVANAEIVADLDIERIVYLGDGTSKGLAEEIALKVLELTGGKLASFFNTFLGFRHGPKSIVNDKTAIVCLMSNNPYTRIYELDLLKEFKNEGGKKQIIVLDTVYDEEVKANSNYYFSYEDAKLGEMEDIFASLSYLVYGQLISLIKSAKLGINPDNPCPTGEVNRVVKGVIIHEYNK